VTSRLLANLRSFVLPLTAAVIVPGLLLRGAPWVLTPVRAATGAILCAAGLAMLVWTVSLFIRIGRGTLAPWDPTRKLVIAGPYAFVRNPMITGVLSMITGEAIAFGSSSVGWWAVIFFAVNHGYFIVSEEPGLQRRFGAEYEEYKRNVPRWIPRPTAWRPPL
jgi:protein-S-isoprenylcysteine O-methyltransferase Ste14